MLTKADKEFLTSTFATKKDLAGFATKKDLAAINTAIAKINDKLDETVDKLDETVDKLDETVDKLDKLIFDVESLKTDHQFVVHHSMENFDTNEKQDKRLDRIETHLGLPALQ